MTKCLYILLGSSFLRILHMGSAGSSFFSGTRKWVHFSRKTRWKIDFRLPHHSGSIYALVSLISAPDVRVAEFQIRGRKNDANDVRNCYPNWCISHGNDAIAAFRHISHTSVTRINAPWTARTTTFMLFEEMRNKLN